MTEEEKNTLVSFKDDPEKRASLLLKDLLSLEEYTNDLFVFAPFPVCYVSLKGVVFEANPAFGKTAGLSLEDITGKQIAVFFNENEISSIQKETAEKGFVEGKELVFYNKERQPIPVRIYTRARIGDDKEFVGYFLSFLDITENKKVEENLKKTQRALLNILEDTDEARKNAEDARAKTEAIITHFVDGLLVFDIDQKLSSVNPQAEKFFDVKARDLVGKTKEELKLFPTIVPLLNVLGETGKDIFRKELGISEKMTLEVSTVGVTSKEKQIGVLVILHDITREKMIEKMKSEFVSIAAHQLRTPLSAIKWTLKMLLDGDLGTVVPEQKDFLDKCYSSNERMINLVNDLLDATRIEEGRYLYKKENADLLSLIEEVSSQYGDMMASKGLKFTLEKEKDKFPTVLVDKEKIKMVVQNLLENAIKYNKPNGEIVIQIRKKEKEIEVFVRDTGVGVPQDQQERVFSKFFRASNVMRMETDGSGLGLFISKNIIESHGGKISFESTENKGTVFYFTLPFKRGFEDFLSGI